jgi:hypothetical protein
LRIAARHTRGSVLDFQLLIVASARFVVVVMGTNVGASSVWRRIWCRLLHGVAAVRRVKYRPRVPTAPCLLRRDRMVAGVESRSPHVVVVPLMVEVEQSHLVTTQAAAPRGCAAVAVFFRRLSIQRTATRCAPVPMTSAR